MCFSAEDVSVNHIFTINLYACGDKRLFVVVIDFFMQIGAFEPTEGNEVRADVEDIANAATRHKGNGFSRWAFDLHFSFEVDGTEAILWREEAVTAFVLGFVMDGETLKCCIYFLRGPPMAYVPASFLRSPIQA